MQPGHFPANILFVIIFVATIVFFWRIAYQLYRIMRLGKGEDRFDRIGKRINAVVTFVLGQRRVVREPSGWGHFLIFWGSIFITIGSFEVFAVGIYHGLNLWKFSGKGFTAVLYLLQDLSCLAMVGALLVSIYRRFLLRPERLRSSDQRATNLDMSIVFAILLAVAVLMLTTRALEYLVTQADAALYFPRAAIVSVALSGLFAGLGKESLQGWYAFFWWSHMLVVLGLIVYMLFSQLLHHIAAIPNIFFRRFRPIGTLSKMDLEDETAESFGVGKVEEFTWKQLLDLYSCTECGRCSESQRDDSEPQEASEGQGKAHDGLPGPPRGGQPRG
jgi:hypothetical protein